MPTRRMTGITWEFEMDKYGVVKGTVKTASADNAGDAVGAAAKCINAAKAAIGGLKSVKDRLPKKEDKKEK